MHLHTNSQLLLFITNGHQTKGQIYISCRHHFVVLHLTYGKFLVFHETCYCTQFQDLRFSSVCIAPASQVMDPPRCKLKEIKNHDICMASKSTSIPNFVLLVNLLKT
jgi:hypothetical protein